MVSFLSIFVIIATTIIGIIITILELRKNKTTNPLDIYSNAPIIHNYTKTQFTEKGYTLLEKDLKKNKNGTYTLVCYKLDHRQGENAPKPKKYKFVVLKGNLVTIGTDGDRVIKALISKNVTDYPEEFLKTNVGKSMLNAGLFESLKETFGEAYKERDKTQRESLIRGAMGEISKHRMGQIEEELGKVYKLMNIMKKDSNPEGKD